MVLHSFELVKNRGALLSPVLPDKINIERFQRLCDFLSANQDNTSAAPLPTRDGVPFTLATGWAWAVTSTRSVRLPLVTELAEFLSDSLFISKWTSAAGFLPPRPSSLALWNLGSDQALVSQIIPSAQIIPDADVTNFLGPILVDVLIRLLKEEITADTAVEFTMDQALQR